MKGILVILIIFLLGYSYGGIDHTKSPRTDEFETKEKNVISKNLITSIL